MANVRKAVSILSVVIIVSTSFSLLISVNARATDSDNDSVPDDEDVDPYEDLEVTASVLWVKGLDHFDHDWLGNPQPPDFWCLITIQGSPSPYSFIQSPASWDQPVRPLDWSYTFDIDDRLTELTVTIAIYEDNNGHADPSNDVLCDLVRYSSSFVMSVTYYPRSASWNGLDYYGDGNGYGHVSGNEDGESTDNVDCDMCFSITQTDNDNDGITSYQETNGFETNIGYFLTNQPTQTNNDDFDGDNLGSHYEFLDSKTSSIRADTDLDGIWDNYEEGHHQLDPRVYSDGQPFIRDIREGMASIPNGLLDLSIWLNHDMMYLLLANMLGGARDEFLDVEKARDEASSEVSTMYLDLGMTSAQATLNYQIAWAMLKFVEAVMIFRFAATYAHGLAFVESYYDWDFPYYTMTVGYIGQVCVGQKHLSYVDSYYPSTVLASPHWTGSYCVPGPGSTLWSHYNSQIEILRNMLGEQASFVDVNGDGKSDFQDFLLVQRHDIQPVLTEPSDEPGVGHTFTRFKKTDDETVLVREAVVDRGYRLDHALLEFCVGVDRSFCRENPSNPFAEDWVYDNIGNEAFGDYLDSDSKVYEAAADICGIVKFGVDYIGMLREAGEGILSYELDRAPPLMTVTINNGASFTSSTTVAVGISASDVLSQVSQMRLSNDGVWDTEFWDPFSTTRSWTIPTGDGSKRIHVQVADSVGNIAEGSASIILDTTAPTISNFQIEGGAETTGNTVWSLTISASDSSSGLSQMRFSETGSYGYGPWEPFSETKEYHLEYFGQCNRYLWVQVSDVVGNIAEASDTITLTACVSILVNGGAAATNNPEVILSITVSGWGTPLWMQFMEFYISEEPVYTPWTAWEEFSDTRAYTIANHEGLHLIYVRVKDSVGQMSYGYDFDGILYDISATWPAQVQINGDWNPTYVSSHEVVLHIDIYDQYDPAPYLRIWNENQNPPSVWTTYVHGDYPWTLSSGEGLKTVNVQYMDHAGNYATVTQTSIVVDSVDPTITSFLIDDGADYATSSSVELTLSATDATAGIAGMRFSNDGATWSAWEAYTSAKSWTLSAGDGLKSVMVEVSDEAGHVVRSDDSIVLDTTAPLVQLLINDGAKYTTVSDVVLTLSVEEYGSGTAGMRISTDGTWDSEEWTPFVHELPWTLESGDDIKTIFVQVKDAYGHLSDTASDGIILATVSPVGGILINSGSQFATQREVNLDVTCDTPGSSPVEVMRFSDDGVHWTEWEAVAASRAWILPEGDGSKSVYMQMSNTDGYVSAAICDEIVLDTVLPDCAIGVVNSQPWQLLPQYNPWTHEPRMLVWWTFESPYGTAYHVDSQGTSNGYDACYYLMGYYSAQIIVPLDGVLRISGYFLQHDLNPDVPYGSPVKVYIMDSELDHPVAQIAVLDPNFERDVWHYRTCTFYGLTPGSIVYVGVGRYDDSNFNLMLTAEWASVSISHSNGIVYNPGQGPLTLSIYGNDDTSGACQMRLSDDGVWDTEEWTPARHLVEWIPPADEGTTTIHMQLRDAAGNIGASSTAACIDATAPTCSLSVQGAVNGCTGSTAVTLLISATDTSSGLHMMRLKNDWSNEEWTQWEPVVAERAWTLTSWDGQKRILLQVRDEAGNLVSTDLQVVLDRIVDYCTILVNDDSQYTNSPTVTLTVAADDYASGLAGIRFSDDQITWSDWQQHTTNFYQWTFSDGDGTRYVFIEAKDCIGNTRIESDSIILDTSVSSASVTIDCPVSYVTSQEITLLISASDSYSGLGQMRFSNDCIAWSDWEEFAEFRSWTLLPGDGEKTVFCQISDNLGNVVTVTDSIILDTQAPVLTFSIDTVDGYATSVAVTLVIDAPDLGTGTSEMRFSNDGQTWCSWEPYASTRTWELTPEQGSKTVFAEVRDLAGHLAAGNDIVILDTGVDYCSVKINGDDLYAASESVTLTLEALDSISGIFRVCYSEDSILWTKWQVFAETKSWEFAPGDGEKTIFYQVWDMADNIAIATDTITLDTTPPVVDFYVDSIADYVVSTLVTLIIYAADAGCGIAEMRFSNDGTTWSPWEAVAGSRAWEIPDGDGSKTVLCQVRDFLGHTATVSYTVILDTSIDHCSVLINNDDEYSSSTGVTLSLQATDSLSGIYRVSYSENGVQWTKWQIFAETRAWEFAPGDGEKTVYYRVCDVAGNEALAMDTIILDTQAPTVSLAINGGDQYANSVRIDISISAVDTGAGVTMMRISDDGTFDTEGWEPYATFREWTLPSGDGVKTVLVQVMDGAGWSSEVVSSTIELDTVPPTTSYWIDSTTITLIADDERSGVQETWYRIDGGQVPQFYTAPFSTGSGTHTVEFWSVDNAGNTELSQFIQVGGAQVLLTVNAGYFGARNVWYPLTGFVTVDTTYGATGQTFEVSAGSPHTVEVQDKIVVGRKSYYFQEWQGFAASTNPDAFVLDADTTLTAVFSTTVRYTLDVRVNDDQLGYTEPIGVQPPSLKDATIQVDAYPNIGYQLSYWLLDGNKVYGNPYTVTMNSNHILQAVFEPEGTPQECMVTVKAEYLDKGTWKPINSGSVTIGTQTVSMNGAVSITAGEYSVTFPESYTIKGKTYLLTIVINGPSSNGESVNISSDVTITARYQLET